ncbi:MAG: TonB-dependent receptor, partial [Xanthomonadaceae bacterium]|nr:TonB-dependent receptor [Xanthomonadaceae bacterium]
NLRSTTAFLATEGALALDLDGTDIDYSSNHPWADSETLMQEFRLSSPVERTWSWVGGVFLLREDALQALDVRLPQSGIRSVPVGEVDTRSEALFGQLAWRFQPDWRARAGLRYSRDRREFDYLRTLTSPLGTSVTTHEDRDRWQAYTPEFSLEHTPDVNRLYYVRVARGYKAGGFNTSTLQASFDPEFLWSYEAGFKATFPRQRLRLNAALFYYDYRDMQLNTPPAGAPIETFPIVINAARATLQGADIELQYQPRWNLGLSMGLALLDARFDEFTSVDLNNPMDDPDRAGNRLPQAPRTSINLGAEYRWRLDDGMLTLGVGARYQSSVFFNIYQDPAVKQDGYSLLDASLAYESRQGRWYAELYGRNLTDRLYAQNIIRHEDRQGTKRYWGPPRTLGLRLGYRW